ncbi:MAG: DNA polymerase III subunit delta [Solirubrobacterales bacterium]
MAEGSSIKPAYLIAGTDLAKIGAALARLRTRAEREGGAAALQAFVSEPGSSSGPDASALVAALQMMCLTTERRYLLADGVECWTGKAAEPVIEAIADLPPDVTLVLVARERPPKARAPKGLAEAVKKAGGEVLAYVAPKPRDLPSWLVEEAKRRQFDLERDAASLLVERLGESTVRQSNELDRLALWAAPGGTVSRSDLEAMVADTSEEVAWALSDALVERDSAAALGVAERLAGQGESVTGLIYQAAKRLREANLAIEALESGRPAKEVEKELPMHPYAAKMLLRRLRDSSPDELRAATGAIADLEWWTRGGSDYPEPVALTLAIRRATERA